jgi:uncharacterized membrane protein
MSKTDEPTQPAHQASEIQIAGQQEIFTGPLPHPEVLRGYLSINTGYPERIFKMAEAHNAADVRMKNKESTSIILGQVFSFFLGCIGFGTSIFLAIRGLQAGAITAAIGGVAPVIIAALSNFRKK